MPKNLRFAKKSGDLEEKKNSKLKECSLNLEDWGLKKNHDWRHGRYYYYFIPMADAFLRAICQHIFHIVKPDFIIMPSKEFRQNWARLIQQWIKTHFNETKV